MAKFTAGVPLNIRLPGGFEAIGAAGTTHRIPDSLVEEFTRDQAPSIPGFAWVTQDETTAMNAATIIVGAVTATSIIASAVTATTAVFKGEPWIDAKAYGATGDGVTDDTAALQLAINALTTGANAQLYIPAGTYLVSATLTLPLMQYKRIFGAGQNATIISATQTNSPILKTTVENTHSIILERLALSYATQRSSSNTSAYALAYTATSAGVGSGFYYWTVRNLLISGANVGIGILAGSGTLPVWGSSFENISMARIATTGLYLKSPTTIGMPALRVDGLRISNSNSTVVNSAQAIYLESAEITFDELDIEGWYNGAFYVQGGNPVAVRGLHIENHRMTTASTLVDISDGPVTVTEAYIIATVNASGATATMFNTFTNGSLDLQHVLLNITKTAGTAYGIAATSASTRGIYVRNWYETAANLSAMFNPNANTLAAIVWYDGWQGRGTVFPTAPLTNDRYFRTDRGIEYFYDGTRWLSVHLYRETLSLGDALTPLSASPVNAGRMASWAGDYDLYLVKYYLAAHIVTTNSTASFWTLAMKNLVGGSTLVSISDKVFWTSALPRHREHPGQRSASRSRPRCAADDGYSPAFLDSPSRRATRRARRSSSRRPSSIRRSTSWDQAARPDDTARRRTAGAARRTTGITSATRARSPTSSTVTCRSSSRARTRPSRAAAARSIDRDRSRSSSGTRRTSASTRGSGSTRSSAAARSTSATPTRRPRPCSGSP
jgi:hypothetical protein